MNRLLRSWLFVSISFVVFVLHDRCVDMETVRNRCNGEKDTILSRLECIENNLRMARFVGSVIFESAVVEKDGVSYCCKNGRIEEINKEKGR